jgi:hypothetical protein
MLLETMEMEPEKPAAIEAVSLPLLAAPTRPTPSAAQLSRKCAASNDRLLASLFSSSPFFFSCCCCSLVVVVVLFCSDGGGGGGGGGGGEGGNGPGKQYEMRDWCWLRTSSGGC